MHPSQQAEILASSPFPSSADSNPGVVSRPRRKRKRRPVLGFGPRLALIGVVSALAVVCLFAAVSKLLQPYQMQRGQSAHIRQLKSQLASTQSANGELQTKIAALKRPDGVETEARSQGFLLPGEVSLDITAEQPAALPANPNTGLPGLLRQALHRLTGR